MRTLLLWGRQRGEEMVVLHIFRDGLTRVDFRKACLQPCQIYVQLHPVGEDLKLSFNGNFLLNVTSQRMCKFQKPNSDSKLCFSKFFLKKWDSAEKLLPGDSSWYIVVLHVASKTEIFEKLLKGNKPHSGHVSGIPDVFSLLNKDCRCLDKEKCKHHNIYHVTWLHVMAESWKYPQERWYPLHYSKSLVRENPFRYLHCSCFIRHFSVS